MLQRNYGESTISNMETSLQDTTKIVIKGKLW